ncbi:SH3 domain-containing protein, partial [Streptomyces sp. NPDC058964]|uniref:SH3 domain-containing protein n=1 Tax=Streptomyces sp. NPDC058964 TaxID=3346681 RepID=UPI0036C5634C
PLCATPPASSAPGPAHRGGPGSAGGGSRGSAAPAGPAADFMPGTHRTRSATETAPPDRPTATGAVDLAGPALHSTGTVGADDRAIVAVLTLHPVGTPYGTAYSRLTHLVASLDVPGAQHPSGAWLGTVGSGVRVRADATTESAVITTLPAGVEVLVDCQKRGRLISDRSRSSDWWAHLPQYGGYLTNVYVDTSGDRIPGVPVC